MSGENTEQVNAQFLTLTNLTDGDEYTQVTNLAFDITQASHFKSLMDGTIERLFGNANNSLDFDVTLTTPEVVKLVELATMINQTTNRTLPIRSWRIFGRAEDNSTFQLTFNGSVVSLRTLRPRVSAATHHVRIEATDIVVS
jgi:tryptophan 2,3-dioxygenase